jgi:hypothetical protein
MFIGIAVGLRDAEPLTASEEACQLSTAWSAVSMFAEMDTATFSVLFTLSNAPMVVTKATSMINARSGHEYMMIMHRTMAPKTWASIVMTIATASADSKIEATAFGPKIVFVVTAAGLREAELPEQCKSLSCGEHCVYVCGHVLGDGHSHGDSHGYIVHVVGKRVVGYHEVDTHDDGVVRLVCDVDEVEAEGAVRRVGQLEDNDDVRIRRRSLCNWLRISSSEEQR